MIIKNHINKIVILGLAGIALLTQPAGSYTNELKLGLPVVKVVPPNGASFMISSTPVVIKHQVTINVFTVDIPNGTGGYATVILQKIGNRYIGLPVLPFMSGE